MPVQPLSHPGAAPRTSPATMTMMRRHRYRFPTSYHGGAWRDPRTSSAPAPILPPSSAPLAPRSAFHPRPFLRRHCADVGDRLDGLNVTIGLASGEDRGRSPPPAAALTGSTPTRPQRTGRHSLPCRRVASISRLGMRSASACPDRAATPPPPRSGATDCE